MAQLVLADWLASTAARLLGDPNRQRVTTEHWIDAYNLSMGDICSTYDILQFEQLADLPLDGIVTYPEENTRISEVAVNSTPSDPSTWRVCREKFQDEYRLLTIDTGLPNQDLPDWYFADQNYLRLGARLAADIVGGLRLTHFGVPEIVTDLTVTYMPLPSFLRSYAMERMLIYGLRGDDRDQQADDHESRWNQREGWVRNKLEDKSADRLDAIRPKADVVKYGGMA